MLDEGEECFAVELVSILDHHNMMGIVQFKVNYSHSETSWHPLELVKSEDSQGIARYILNNDGCWARYLLQSMCFTLRRLYRTTPLGFDSISYNPSPK